MEFAYSNLTLTVNKNSVNRIAFGTFYSCVVDHVLGIEFIENSGSVQIT